MALKHDLTPIAVAAIDDPSLMDGSFFPVEMIPNGSTQLGLYQNRQNRQNRQNLVDGHSD
jgi:hypothetical protein